MVFFGYYDYSLYGWNISSRMNLFYIPVFVWGFVTDINVCGGLTFPAIDTVCIKPTHKKFQEFHWNK